MDYWIVVVDDETMSLTNVRSLLVSEGMKISCLKSGAELLTFMGRNNPDLILLDVMMPEMDGFETLIALRKQEKEQNKPQTPVIFLTGESDYETEQKGLKLGAADYIHKPFNKDILIRRIKNSIRNSRKIESLTEGATIDRLTGFLNRAEGPERIKTSLERLYGALLMLDLDSFKLVNDLFGHEKGDEILKAFADVTRNSTREGDILCRMGGDEFLIFCEGLNGESAVAAFTARLNDQFEEQAKLIIGKEHGIPLGISVGAVMVPDYGRDYDVLYKLADEAMYRTKQNGKHGFTIYENEDGTVDPNLDPADELDRITKIISERNQGRDALILGTDAFATVYHFVERFNSRYGGKSLALLFIVNEKEGNENIDLREFMIAFGEVLKKTLRKSDIIMQCRNNQYYVLLPMMEEPDEEGVMKRIMSSWNEIEHHEDFYLKTASQINGADGSD